MRGGLGLATVGTVVALAVIPAGSPSASGRVAKACPNQAVNGGKVLGRETLRVVVIGRVSCREAHRRVSAYFHQMAAGGCGKLNNFCDLSFPGGWACSIFFAAESRETGGAIAGCAHNHARIRLYRTNGKPGPPSAPSNPTEFRARLAGGTFGCAVNENAEALCTGVPSTPEGGTPFVQVARLQPDGQSTGCVEHGLADTHCFSGNLGDPVPYLSPGQQSSVGPFTCKVLEASVECTVTATGKGFVITPTAVTEVGG